MEAHQQRVQDELTELETKRGNLGKFIGENPIFHALSSEERERLQRQLAIMLQYEEVLSERIRAFAKR